MRIITVESRNRIYTAEAMTIAELSVKKGGKGNKTGLADRKGRYKETGASL